MTKITYEMDSIDDSGDIQVYEIAKNMMSALFDLQRYTRELYKGWKPFDQDEVLDRLNDILYNSKIDEVE